MIDQDSASALRSGIALLAVSYIALFMVGMTIPARNWLWAAGFTVVALLTAYAAGGELRDAREARK